VLTRLSQGIVTRRPLVRPSLRFTIARTDRCPTHPSRQILQLINRPATSQLTDGAKETAADANLNEDNADEWGEFLHLPGEKFHDFGKIREEIVRDTERHTGKNAGRSLCWPLLEGRAEGADPGLLLAYTQASRLTRSTFASTRPTF
jgi:hypothetical protein